MSNRENNILKQIRDGDEMVITKLYNLYRTPFVEFASNRYLLDNATALDIYQESFIAFYQNVRNRRLFILTVSIKSYLFSIGHNKICNYYREKEKHSECILKQDFYMPEFDDEDWMSKQEIAYELVVSMGEPCNTVLRLYYWERKLMAEIAKVMKYSNEQVAKNRKSLCVKKLKALLLTRFKTEGLI